MDLSAAHSEERKIDPTESSTALTMDPREAFISIRKKISLSGAKLATIVGKCELLDRNSDGVLHVDDLEDVIQETLKEQKLTTREMNHLLGSLSRDKRRGNVEYNKLFDVLESTKLESSKKNLEEKWYDRGENGSEQIHAVHSSADLKSPGTVGDFLQRAACPSEIKNFKRFISCLEKFERDSGMKIKQTEEGFIVPLGPDLRVGITFFMP